MIGEVSWEPKRRRAWASQFIIPLWSWFDEVLFLYNRVEMSENSREIENCNVYLAVQHCLSCNLLFYMVLFYMVFQYIVYYIALPSTTPESTYRGRDENWLSVSAHSAGTYTATLYVMVLGWKGVQGVLESAIATLCALCVPHYTVLYFTFYVLNFTVLSDVTRPSLM